MTIAERILFSIVVPIVTALITIRLIDLCLAN